MNTRKKKISNFSRRYKNRYNALPYHNRSNIVPFNNRVNETNYNNSIPYNYFFGDDDCDCDTKDTNKLLSKLIDEIKKVNNIYNDSIKSKSSVPLKNDHLEKLSELTQELAKLKENNTELETFKGKNEILTKELVKKDADIEQIKKQNDAEIEILRKQKPL